MVLLLRFRSRRHIVTFQKRPQHLRGDCKIICITIGSEFIHHTLDIFVPFPMPVISQFAAQVQPQYDRTGNRQSQPGDIDQGIALLPVKCSETDLECASPREPDPA